VQRLRLGPSPRDDEKIIYAMRRPRQKLGFGRPGLRLKRSSIQEDSSRWDSKRYLSASRLTMASELPESRTNSHNKMRALCATAEGFNCYHFC
jgi:hypothetical protein